MKIRQLPFSLLFLTTFFFSCQNETTPPPATPPAEEVPENPRFELIPDTHSGVIFSNNITENHRINIVSNSYMYNGGGVAILDVNNDGLQDLYFTSTQESNRLYLNRGNFQFKDITQTAGVAAIGGFKTGVTVVDINTDGLPDLYVCRSGLHANDERRNLLFVNNGDMTFTEKARDYGLDDMSASNHANFFDYDKDGDLDVYVINHPISFGEVNKISVSQTTDGKYVRNTAPRDEFESDKLFRNNGNGTFTDVSRAAGIQNRAWALSVNVADFNEDGWPDIFVGNDYIEPDLLYINNKRGGFEVQTDQYFRHTSNHTMGVDIADYNNDGRMDLVALDMIAEDNQRQKELMTTMILERYNSLVRFGYGHQIMRNMLQLNNGAHGFSEIGTLAGISNTDWSWACLLADFDNDAYKDLYVTNGYRRDVTNLDYLTYTVDSINRSGGLTQFKDFEDYLKKVPTKKLQNYMFRNRGDLTFEKVSTSWGFNQKSYSNGAAWADLDNDGDLDLVANNIHDKAFIYKNKTREQSGGHYLQMQLAGAKANPLAIGAKVKIYTGDQTQVQELRTVRGFFSSVEPIFHFGLGKKQMVDRIEILWPDGFPQVLEQVPADQRLHLKRSEAKKGAFLPAPLPDPVFELAQPKGLDFRHTENPFLDFDRERLLPHQLSKLGPAIAVADVNGDGLDDFYIGGAVNQSGALFVQNPDGSFAQTSAETWAPDSKYEDIGALFFDADQDGDQDLYVVSGGNVYSAHSPNYQDRVYLNDGAGHFRKKEGALPEITSSGSCVAAFDFDGDGDQDLFVGGRVTPGAYPTPPQSYVLRNDGGQFRDVTDEVAPDFKFLGMVTDIVFANLDQDTAPEMVVSGEWMPVEVFKINGGKLTPKTANFGLEKTNGWWNCFTAHDMDGDGDVDLLGGNRGLNSRLKASPEAPLTLFAADFDHNSSIDPILAWYDNGQLYPVPQRDAIIKQLPYLKKKFVRFRNYATSTIEQVFSSEELKKAQKMEAYLMATSYFENDGNGHFTRKDLPVPAQFSPCFEIQCGDWNGDGHEDFVMVGNSYAPEVETGRYDAGNGALFLGDGKGNFKFVPNIQSGFWATKEARDLEILNTPAGKLFLIANNDDVLEAYTLKQPAR